MPELAPVMMTTLSDSVFSIFNPLLVNDT